MLRLVLASSDEQKEIFITEVQEAFQEAFEAQFGKWEKTIIPRKDIEESFAREGAEIYFAEVAGERVGGTVVVIDELTQRNSLDLLYVRVESQNGGFGKKIWDAIEKQHPQTKVWETHTPYFDQRNIHFYVNRCGFKIVEFFNEKHKDPHHTNDTVGGLPAKQDAFFRFEKEM